MLELLARLRDVVIAVALAWIGVTVATPSERQRESDTATLAPVAETARDKTAPCPDGMGRTATGRQSIAMVCLDGETCPPSATR